MNLSAAAGQRRTGRPHLGPRDVVPAAMWPPQKAGTALLARSTCGRVSLELLDP